MKTERLVMGALLAVMVGFMLIAIAAAALCPLDASPDAAATDQAVVEHSSTPPGPAVSL